MTEAVAVAIVTTLPATIAAMGAFYLSYRSNKIAGGTLAATKQDLENAKVRIADIQSFVEHETPENVELPAKLLARIPSTLVENAISRLKGQNAT